MAKKRTRSNGDADVYPRRNREGKVIGYRGAYWVTDPATGGRKRHYVSGKTKAETRLALSLAKNGLDNPSPLAFDPQEQTVSEYMTRWLEDSAKMRVGTRTYQNYAAQIRLHISPAFGSLELSKLTASHIQSLYAAKMRDGLSAGSIRQIHTVLSRALGEAVRLEHLDSNPVSKAKPPKSRPAELVPLSPDEARTFLDAARGEPLEALYVLSITCGLRCGEALGLKWSDIDFDKGTLRVNRQLQRIREGGGLVFSEPKYSSRRTIALPQRALESLRSHRKRQLEERRAGSDWRDKGLVFATHKGTPLDAQNMINRHFKPLLKRAGLPEIRWHDLRHTCATLLFEQGEHPGRVQHLLGHATIAQTMDRYSHFLPSMSKQTAAAMDAALG